MKMELSKICFMLGVLLAVTVSSGTSENDGEVRLNCALVYPMNETPRKNYFQCPANAIIEFVGNSNWKKARGLTCVSSGGCQDITVPIRKEGSDLKPMRLTYTVGSDQDVIINFQEPTPGREILWQKEPAKQASLEWSKANLTTDNKLTLPKESGLYSFAYNNHESSVPLNRLGTVAVIRRKCPMNWYGGDCKHSCKDCMYGGICDADTGECICPPGREGEFCEKACEGDNLLSNCTESHGFQNGVQICLPPPYGCSCLPGRKGFKCDQKCDPGSWGVDCSQTCSHCDSNECDPKTGNCTNNDLKACAGGPLGLPRLRQVPRVTPGIAEATVKWEKVFDGELSGKTGEQISESDIKGYFFKLWNKNHLTLNRSIRTSSTLNITSLRPATEYKLAVLVEVEMLDNTSCIVDGLLRGERIHEVIFTTKDCPAEPFMPCDIITHSDLTSVVVEWSFCEAACQSKSYELNFSGEVNTTKEMHYEFHDLTPGTGYNLTLRSCIQSNCSEPLSKEVSTLLVEPQVEDIEPKVMKSDGNATKIELPKIKGAKEADQYVVVMNDNGTMTNEQVKEKSVELVKGRECLQEKNNKNKNNNNKNCTKAESDDAWVAIEVKVEEKNEMKSVSIGTGVGEDRVFDPKKKYKVTVVTATQSGPYRKYAVTEPVSISLSEGISAGMTGALYSIAVFVALALCAVYRYKKQQPQVVVRIPMEGRSVEGDSR